MDNSSRCHASCSGVGTGGHGAGSSAAKAPGIAPVKAIEPTNTRAVLRIDVLPMVLRRFVMPHYRRRKPGGQLAACITFSRPNSRHIAGILKVAGFTSIVPGPPAEQGEPCRQKRLNGQSRFREFGLFSPFLARQGHSGYRRKPASSRHRGNRARPRGRRRATGLRRRITGRPGAPPRRNPAPPKPRNCHR